MSEENDMTKKHKYIEKYFENFKKCIDTISVDQIVDVIECIENAYQGGKQIFIIGNGGSASTASHMANDFGKIVSLNDNGESAPRFRVISLTDNVSWITALANDFGYEHIFAEQMRNLLNKGDLVIVITGSGNSLNILEGIRVAKARGACVIGMLGFNGGRAKKLVDHYILVNSDNYGYIENIHMVLDHLFTDFFKRAL